ncbi:MAG: ATPase [Bacteroidales bacterium]|nr:ATPase [Bacteroidales bacterium]
MLQFNPFIITSDYYGPDFFCDRNEETEILERNILNGRNTVLISSRRMGKSGLIAHVFNRELVKTNFKTFTIDLFPTSSLSEMILLLAKNITGELKSKGNKIWESFLSIVKSLRPGFKIDPLTGQFTFDISLGEISKPADSLEEIFNYLEASDRPCLIAIDEFQQIAEYPEHNVTELLRTYVQKCKHTWFIFAGSDRRMMEKMFNNPSEPFYMSCSPLYLDAIPYERYLVFAKQHFAATGKNLEEDCFRHIYELFEGHTWYVQRTLNELFDWTNPGETARMDIVPDVVTYIIKTYARTFQEQVNMFPESQKRLLIAIAKEGKAERVTSAAFCNRHFLKSPSTVQSALRALHEKGIVRRDGNTYSITNRFLGSWLAKEY